MFILDTNVISELRHGKPNQSVEVRKWAAGQSSSKLFYRLSPYWSWSWESRRWSVGHHLKAVRCVPG